MADVLPIAFPIPGENSIASYSYNDIAEGTGILKLYGFVTQDSVSKKYKLSENPLYSDMIEVNNSDAMTIDFNLSEFNLPRTLGGTAMLNAAVGINLAVGGSATGHIDITISKVSGGAATTIATAASPTMTAPPTTLKIICTAINLPQTHFKKGDILRLTTYFNWANLAGTNGMVIGTDPQNRDGTYIKPSTDKTTTKLEFYVPFKLNL